MIYKKCRKNTRLAQFTRLSARSARRKQLSTVFFSSPRFALLHYPERAKELFEKAEATAKAKYERLVKFVDFYS